MRLKVEFQASVFGAAILFIAIGLLSGCGASTPNDQLLEAAELGDLSEAQAALAQKADPNEIPPEGGTPLVLAARNGHLDVVRALLAAGAKVDGRTHNGGLTPLIVAAHFGHVEVLTALLSAGANVEARDNDGVTALIDAAMADQPDSVRVLAAAGAEVNALGPTGETPLRFAIEQNHRDIADLLRQVGGHE